MIHIEGRKIVADTLTQKIVFEGGRVVEITSKLDGKTYLQESMEDLFPIQLRFSDNRFTELTDKGEGAGGSISVVRYNDHMVNVVMNGWYGHGELLIEEDISNGAVCISPSAHTTLPEVRSCIYDLSGFAPELELVLPLKQGMKAGFDDEIFKWLPEPGVLDYPHTWEESFVAFASREGGIWIFNEGQRYRYKTLRIGGRLTPYGVGLETENYGPLQGKLSAGGITWKINCYQGDWTVPVKNYKQILMKEPAWTEAKGTLPDWFDDIKLAYCWCPTDPAILDTLKKYINPKNVLIHLSDWRTLPYDQGYPEYTASEAAKAFIQKGNDMGFHVAPHFNAFEIDPSVPEFELVRDFRYRSINERRAQGWTWLPYTDEKTGRRVYTRLPEDNIALRNSRHGNVMTKIHPALPAWRNLLLSNVKKAIDDNEIHVAFLDITLTTYNLFNAQVNDATTMEGARELLTMAKKINGNLAIGGEGMNETLLCQSFAQGHSLFGPDEEMVPVEKYIPVNKILYADLCHQVGYHGQLDFERKCMQDACDEKRGFVPTILGGDIYDLDEKNSISKKILERAVD
ncbi:MAG: hypothetical protein IKC46_09210 [Lachnospiraceae bacterium]|nr:hypothetical protein [Lachnospiraceae bacterium]